MKNILRIFYKIIRFPLLVIRLFFLGIFKTLKTFSELIYNTIKYFIYGVVFISHILYSIISKFIKYFTYGIVYIFVVMYVLFKKTGQYLLYSLVVLSFIFYKIIKYFLYGTYFPFVFVVEKKRIISDKNRAKKEKLRIEKIKAKIEKKAQRQRQEEARVIEKTRILDKKKELRDQEKKRKQSLEFINENVSIEDIGFKYRLKQASNVFNNLPEKIKKKLKSWYENLSFIKARKNRFDIERQELLINFEGEDAVKSTRKIPYEYVVKTSDGKIIRGHYEAFSKVEVHSFLLSENYVVYSIKTSRWIQIKYGRKANSRMKFKVKDLVFFLTQLSTYIKSGITLVEALRILSRQYKNKQYKQAIRNIIYELTMGENFSNAMEKQGMAFPKLLINMVKASEMTGELPEALDDMADYYTEADKTRKQMITAMTYPVIIFVLATAVIVFVLLYVVPKFTDIYSSMEGTQIPDFTKFVMNASAFIKENVLKILIVLVVLLIAARYLYIYIKSFKTMIQWILMHIPVFGNVIIYNEVTMFTKTFASLLKHNVFITESMEILTKLTSNEIYKMIILDTISNLAHGDKLSLSFKNHWAFPIPAYEMLVTGEKTGELPEMMAKVSSYYQELHKNSVTRIKTFVEPILIIFLTVVVGAIILAIVLPMFSLYQQVQGM